MYYSSLYYISLLSVMWSIAQGGFCRSEMGLGSIGGIDKDWRDWPNWPGLARFGRIGRIDRKGRIRMIYDQIWKHYPSTHWLTASKKNTIILTPPPHPRPPSYKIKYKKSIQTVISKVIIMIRQLSLGEPTLPLIHLILPPITPVSTFKDLTNDTDIRLIEVSFRVSLENLGIK